MFNLHNSKKENKNTIKDESNSALIFLICSTIIFIIFSLFYCSTFIRVNKLTYENNLLTIELNNIYQDINNKEIYVLSDSGDLNNIDNKINIKIFSVSDENKILFNKEIVESNALTYSLKAKNVKYHIILINPIIKNKTNIPLIYLIKNHNHDYKLLDKESYSATCEKDGRNYYKCLDCSSIYYEKIDSLGHNEYGVEYEHPTCTKKGYSRMRCDRCGESRYEYIKELEHALIFSKNIIPANCIQKKIDLHHCQFCSFEKEIEGDFGNHNYQYHNEGVNGNTVFLNRKCSICNKISAITKPLKTGSFSGCFYLPAFNYMIPTYTSDSSQGQYICDLPDSAYYRPNWKYIADHNYQGFNIIMKAVPNKTIAYFAGQKYICNINVRGYNNRYDVVSKDGLGIRSFPSDFVCYTCHDWDGYDVQMVGFTRVLQA